MKQNTIKFILDGQIKEVFFEKNGLRPTTTLLNYLRSLSGHKGVKEGCAEGDCGACTIVIAEPVGKKMTYKAFDSCLVFLPQVHGKQVITVENVGGHENLHPIQQAMVELDGSQCGFCTPGFIMSMFALYKNCNNPNEDTITDFLTGNLCRCTGYKPIIDAAKAACNQNGKDHFSGREDEIIALLEPIRKNKTAITIETGIQSYFLPQSLNDALELKAKHPDALLICGGTDVALRVTKKHELLAKIIDISLVEELKFYDFNNDFVTLGAGLDLESVRQLVENKFPALFEMLSVFGSRQIRNKATFGGNTGSASPIGDTPPVLMAFDASLVLAGINGEREVKMRDFVTAYRKTVIRGDEIIKSVRIPMLKEDTRVKAYKISKRKDLDISTVSAGFRLEIDKGKKVKEIDLFFGGMAAMTIRAKKTEAFIKGKIWDRSLVEKAMQIVDEDFTPISDARSSAEGRKLMAKNLLMKFYLDVDKD